MGTVIGSLIEEINIWTNEKTTDKINNYIKYVVLEKDQLRVINKYLNNLPIYILT